MLPDLLGTIPRLFIFDADDTLRHTLVPGQPSPRAADEWELLPGVAERLQMLPWRSGKALLGVASNQDQVGYGLVSERVARRLLVDMLVAATGHRPPLAAVQLCPHVPAVRCGCRKPEPGMLLSIMHFYGVPPERTLFVGNSPIDAAAAQRAGVSFEHAEDFFSVPYGWVSR